MGILVFMKKESKEEGRNVVFKGLSRIVLLNARKDNPISTIVVNIWDP